MFFVKADEVPFVKAGFEITMRLVHKELKFLIFLDIFPNILWKWISEIKIFEKWKKFSCVEFKQKKSKLVFYGEIVRVTFFS